MAKKTKKAKKQQNAEHRKLQKMSPEGLVLQADSDIASGNIRNAISLYKLAIKNHGDEDRIHPLLFKAYLARSRQLKAKGMAGESEAILKNAYEIAPDPAALSEKDLLSCIEIIDLSRAMQFYKDYALGRGGISSADKTLAGRLVLEDHMAALDILDDDFSLKSHADDVAKSLVFMNQSAWKEAFEALTSVPRTSPWSDLKLFCKAMVSFADNDDKTLTRCLSSLSNTTFFPATVSALTACVTEPPHQLPENFELTEIFFEGDHHGVSLIRQLADGISKNKTQNAAPLIKELTSIMAPGQSTEFIVSLMDLIWQKSVDESILPEPLAKLTASVLPSAWGEIVLEKAYFNYGPDFLCSACDYLDLIDSDFKDDVENIMARSEWFSRIAQRLLDDSSEFYSDQLSAEALAERIDDENFSYLSSSPRNFCFALLYRAIRMDPKNREAYMLASRFSPMNVSSKDLETIFESMMTHFPEDPFPCLKLADLYDMKNAYRKSASILKEAIKRAPQDRAVHERHAFSFVIAAEKNMKPGKLHLADADLVKAESMNVQAHAWIIAGKKMVADSIRTKNVSPEALIKTHASGQTPWEALRTLTHVIFDLTRKKLPTGPWKTQFKTLLKEKKRSLSSKELAGLLRPVEEKHQPVYPSMHLGDLFFTLDKTLVKAIDDEDLICLLTETALIQEDLIDVFIRDFKRRLKGAKKGTKTLLQFCIYALEYIDGDDRMQPRLKEIAETATPDITSSLKAISRHFALIADRDIRGQFYHFDFSSSMNDLPDFFKMLFGFEEGSTDDEDDEDDDDNQDTPEETLEIIVEDFNDALVSLAPKSPLPKKQRVLACIDRLLSFEDLNAASDNVILESRKKVMEAFPFLEPEMNRSVSILGPSILVNLPRETYVFLTGKCKPVGGI